MSCESLQTIMPDHPKRKRPSLRAPLIFLAISAAGTIVGFGLCARNFMRNNRLGTIGADAFLICGAGVIAALVWLIVVAIMRKVRERSR
jgi:hypothetical protein